MHICLLPTETLFCIFTSIFEAYVYRSTLAALARTCRTFKEPALDILWKDLSGFEPFILCLPESVRKRDVLGKLVSWMFQM